MIIPKKNIIIILVTILFLQFILTTPFKSYELDNKPVFGSIYYVGGAGAGNYSTIQGAINDASNGDTVFIYNGSYYENLEINKSISLIGQAKQNVIIDAQYKGSVCNISSDWVSVSNMTLKNTGNYSGVGVYADSGVFFQYTNEDRKNCIISNNIFIDCLVGVKSFGADNLTIINNSVTLQNYNFSNGVRVEDTKNCYIIHNTIINCSQGIYLGYQSKNNILRTNVIKNCTGHGIKIYSGSQENAWNRIENNTVIDNGEYGIYLESSANNSIYNNHVVNNIWGIALRFDSHDNLISSNTVINHSRGIYLLQAPYSNTICKNNVSNNDHGIWLYSSSYNTIVQNNMTNNIRPIKMNSNCQNNIVAGNWIKNNAFTFSLQSSNNDNLIYHNNFINNTNLAYDDGSNQWDNSYPSGGNFWSDYPGVDTNNDGIGDDPYNITGGTNQDLYPLMHPYGSISELPKGWNFLSLPVNHSCVIENVMISSNHTLLSFQQAVNQSILSPFLFEWNRLTQSYEFANVFNPGYGYWMYVFKPCEIWYQYDKTSDESYITTLNNNWNIFSIPFDENIDKSNMIVNNVSWDTAVSNGWINDYVFGWNRQIQQYDFVENFDAGYCYWLYASQTCIIKTVQ